MSWSIEEHIGEGRPWPVQVVVYRGETGECLSYVSGEVADRLKAENATLRDYIERKRALQDFARLVEERGELREFCAELYGFVSRADRMQYPELGDRMRELATENDRLQASNEVIAEDHAALCEQNTKLRELVALCIVIDKHMSLCATTDCGQCPVREECGESVYLEGLLGIDPKGLSWRVQERMAETADVQVENANLRELVRDMWPSYCYANSGCETFLTDEQDVAIRERVRRLKVINK